MERRYLLDGEPLTHEMNGHHQEEDPFVRLVKRQRRGWYLIPNPIHNILRQFINGVVIVLLASLFYLFISPVLELLSIPFMGWTRSGGACLIIRPWPCLLCHSFLHPWSFGCWPICRNFDGKTSSSNETENP